VRVEDGDLTLEKIRREDSGKYECVASNIVTSVITATQLIVECKTLITMLCNVFENVLQMFYFTCNHRLKDEGI